MVPRRAISNLFLMLGIPVEKVRKQVRREIGRPSSGSTGMSRRPEDAVGEIAKRSLLRGRLSIKIGSNFRG